MKFIITIITLFVLLLISLAFGVNNDQSVVVNYLIAQSELRLSSLLAIVLAVGFCFAAVLFSVVMTRQKVQLRLLRNNITKLEKEQSN